MEKGSALQERRSGERRQGKEDRGSAGEGPSQGGAPYQWAAGGGVARLTADGTGRRALESSCDCDRALRLLSLVRLASSPWSDWPWSLRIWGLEGGQLAGKPGHGVLEGSVGLRRASGKGGAAVRERKRWGVMGAQKAPSPGEAEEEGEGGGQSEGWPHSRGCLGPERTGVKVGPHGRVRLC